MEKVEPYQQYLGRRLALDMRLVMHDATHELETSPSVGAFVQCFEDHSISPYIRSKPTTQALMNTIDMYSDLFRMTLTDWARRKGHMAGKEPLEISIFATLLQGGMSKLQTEINRNPFDMLEESQAQLTRNEVIGYLPLLVMLSLGRTVQAAGQESPGSTLQKICQEIRERKKPSHTSKDPLRRFLSNATTTLMEAYHGITPAKFRAILPQVTLFVGEITPYDGNLNFKVRLEQIRQRVNTLFGEVGFSEAEVARMHQSNSYKKEVQRLARLQDSQREAAWQNQNRALQQLVITRLARRLVDNVASGAIDWDIILALEQTYGGRPGPLQLRAVEAEQPLHKVWRRVETSSHLPQQPGSSEELERITFLRELMSGWKDAVLMQREGADLGTKYFVAVFPEVLPDGRVIEHVIADHPDPEDHAIYAWRAENGIQSTGQIVRTWREVFASPNRTAARSKGAIRIFHSEGYKERTLAYLTDPPKELARKHMQRTRPQE